MEDEFNILAAKVLAGEATEEEQSRLRTLLGENEDLRKEFAALEATWKSLGTLGPLVSSLNPAPAPIPADRLRRLQQVVRDDAKAKHSAKSKQAGPSRRHDQDFNPVSALVWNWLHRHLGTAPTLVSFALLAVLVGVVFLMNRPATNPGIAASAPPVAYLLTGQGRPEIRRDGQSLVAESVTSLRSADEVYLSPGAEADIITADQVFRFQGPRTIEASALSGVAVMPQAHSNLTAQTEALRTALFEPVPQLLAANLLVTTRGGQGIPLYSPVGATANLAPPILWKAEPGKTYDLRITDEFNSTTPAWTLVAVTPPVEFAKVEAWRNRPLAKDGLYRLRVSESGRPVTACEYTFRTVEDAGLASLGNAADPVLTAFRILTIAPSRVGDALALLLRLPPQQADREMTLRLKLLAFGQLGYQEDFEATTAHLARSVQTGR